MLPHAARRSLHAFYTHLDFGGYGAASGTGIDPVHGNAFGGSVSGSLFKGRLGLSAMGGYLVPSCPSGVACSGFASVGGTAIYRLLRAPIMGDSGGRVTLSLRGSGARAFAPDSDKYVSATVGLPIAFSAPEGKSYRIVGFVAPGIAWASLETHVLNDVGEIAPFDHDGARGMLSGGIGLMPRGSGVGVSIGFQRIFVDQAGTQFGATLTWNMPQLGDR